MSISSLCIIPARGGSKRIPGKNIKSFLGRPIIAYSIETALKSNLFSEVMVSTDDEAIAEVARQYGAKVPFFRSANKADDYATLTDVILEVIGEYEKQRSFDIIGCILPTAPFVTIAKLKEAWDLLVKGQHYTSVFPVVSYGYPIQRSLKKNGPYLEMRWPENVAARSQDLEPSYHDAGQFYLITKEALLSEKKLFTSRAGAIELNELEMQDIDTEVDWKLAELKYELLHTQANE